ncbi:CehA/McbA family metallohydrolase [Paenibacillus sacheonensis]|uniref:PHP domain-containing protein n=1 Tax=Paenibacillus sacheonensis TaxID=742054 RepID=A0A7X5C2P2_9BACL|nr:CehA/McbA family metallohydrolase [Paenibacillus sacheonensis]MBM7566394.1 roadblock/LC7 domain-containing protein [Paenibacillus sacheonensis]NBC70594.1 PHP domain-containing protein [Paenibacillus sacheonensis]
MRWMACELHSHTYHSDGRQSLLELAQGARALGFDCVALTDHNTMTGLENKELVEQATGMTIISGMEWTTFYGHMVTIGLIEFVDWRPAGPRDIQAGIAKVHAHGGIAGLAHPFRIGSPMCTGCFWEFEIADWNAVDYIEVWSGTFPSIKTDNARAFRLWTEQLNAGYRIAATSGRDWHAQDRTEDPVSVTYLLLDDSEGSETERAVRALAAGRASVTMGPLVTLALRSETAVYGIGDRVPKQGQGNGFYAVATIDFQVRADKWAFPGAGYSLAVTSNLGVIGEISAHAAQSDYRFDIPGEGLLWMRAELKGTVRGVRTTIAFTNAIYLDPGEGV